MTSYKHDDIIKHCNHGKWPQAPEMQATMNNENVMTMVFTIIIIFENLAGNAFE
jgi:hypothetical protein